MSVELIARAWERAVDSAKRRRSAYKASWSSIVTMLRGELHAIGARSVIVEFDLDAGDIRNDGWMRSTARPRTPGVRLTFTSKHGPLAYECGTWADWQHNVYAIARTLRAQRMMAKDGAIKGDQIYMGFKQLPPGAGAKPINAGEWPNVEAAAEFLHQVVHGEPGSPLDRLNITEDAATLDRFYRAAARKAHPDTGGTNELMSKVNRAKTYIEGGG